MLINEIIKALGQTTKPFKNNFGLVKAFVIMTPNPESTTGKNQHMYLYKKKSPISWVLEKFKQMEK